MEVERGLSPTRRTINSGISFFSAMIGAFGFGAIMKNYPDTDAVAALIIAGTLTAITALSLVIVRDSLE